MGRALATLTAAAAAGCVIAACGGSGSGKTSNPSPANKVPADAVAYASVTVRPSQSVTNDLVQTIDKLAGAGAAARLGNEFVSGLGNNGDLQAFEKWGGSQIGIALTGLPAGNLTSQAAIADLLVVVPVTNPTAAKQYIAAHPPTQQGITTRVEGGYLISAGAAALSQVATSSSTSLAANSAYKSAISQLGGNQLATVFVRAHQLVQQLVPELQSSGASDSTTSTLEKDVPAGATLALGFSVGTNTFAFDAVSHGFPASAGGSSQQADVGSLPATSWLALAFDISPQAVSSLEAEIPGLAAQAEHRAGAAGSTVQGFVPLLEHYVIPALGPTKLSVSGSSPGGLQAGLALTPHNAAAGDRLFTLLERMLKGEPVLTSKVGSQLVLSFGYANPQDLLSPSSSLSENATYKAAVAHLPAGSKVPFYLNFGPVAALGALDKSAGDASVWRVVKKLNYLIAGGTHTHFRIVLAVK